MSTVEVVANWEVFIWALYRLGGSSQFVDIEDVALKCFDLAPARFAWRTRKDLPDYKKCAKALQEAERRRPSMFIKTRDAFTRQLTVEGQQWVKANSDKLLAILEVGAHVPEPKLRPSARMLSEIERSQPFLDWRQSGAISKEKWRIAEVLRCSPDSNIITWSERLESARAVANSADRKDILNFFNCIFLAHPDWFGGTKT